jgi:hypothetical protein
MRVIFPSVCLCVCCMRVCVAEESRSHLLYREYMFHLGSNSLTIIFITSCEHLFVFFVICNIFMKNFSRPDFV